MTKEEIVVAKVLSETCLALIALQKINKKIETLRQEATSEEWPEGAGRRVARPDPARPRMR